MLKIVKTGTKSKKIIPMFEMKPLEVGIVVEASNCCDASGHYVMRTANRNEHEVMDLTACGANECWTGGSTIMVELLKKGEKITIELYNE